MSPSSPSTTNSSLNASSTRNVPLNASTPLEQPISEVLLQPYLRNLSTDIFTGQIIASLIVLAFLAVFLLREWIQQNARPGVFDDGPIPEVPVPVDAQPQVELPHEDAAVVQDRGPEDAADWAPGVAANDEPPLPLLRPVPDVPEDVHPAGPSSSSSSSDTEGPPSRPVPAHLDAQLPVFGRRKREIPKRRLRGINPTRRRYFMEEDRIDGIDSRSNRPKREREGEVEESFHLEVQPDQPSSSRRFPRSRPYALERRPKVEKVDGALADEESASGSGSEPLLEPGSKTRQKRKASDSDTELMNRDGSISSTISRSLSPSSADFEFTFKPSPSPSEGPSSLPAPCSFPGSGEFGLKSNSTYFPPSSAPSSSSTHSTSSLPQPLDVGSSYAVTFSDVFSSSANGRHSTFELPPPTETNRGALAELPYPLTPRSLAPPSTSSGSLFFPEDAERTTFQFPHSLQPPSPPSSPSHLVLTSRRPSLPNSTLSTAELISADPSSSTAGAEAPAPLPSPHLAIYRPPEELKVEDDEYFDTGHFSQEHGAEDEEEDEDEDDARLAYYFQEPEQDDTREVPPPLLPDTDDEDDEDDGHEGEEVREGVDAGPPGDVPPAGDADGQDVDAEVADDEREQNIEEDLDGAMEGIYHECMTISRLNCYFVDIAVGLRGPVFSVFQNVNFSSFDSYSLL